MMFLSLQRELKMEKRKGISELKSVDKELRGLIFSINDIYLIAIILMFLTPREIRKYSLTSKSDRELSLQLGLNMC